MDDDDAFSCPNNQCGSHFALGLARHVSSNAAISLGDCLRHGSLVGGPPHTAGMHDWVECKGVAVL
jgi:hypothetical protein